MEASTIILEDSVTTINKHSPSEQEDLLYIAVEETAELRNDNHLKENASVSRTSTPTHTADSVGSDDISTDGSSKDDGGMNQVQENQSMIDEEEQLFAAQVANCDVNAGGIENVSCMHERPYTNYSASQRGRGRESLTDASYNLSSTQHHQQNNSMLESGQGQMFIVNNEDLLMLATQYPTAQFILTPGGDKHLVVMPPSFNSTQVLAQQQQLLQAPYSTGKNRSGMSGSNKGGMVLNIKQGSDTIPLMSPMLQQHEVGGAAGDNKNYYGGSVPGTMNTLQRNSTSSPTHAYHNTSKLCDVYSLYI